MLGSNFERKDEVTSEQRRHIVEDVLAPLTYCGAELHRFRGITDSLENTFPELLPEAPQKVATFIFLGSDSERRPLK